MTRFRDDWPPDAVTRFWDHLAARGDDVAYFSDRVGRGVIGLARREGAIDAAASVLDMGCGKGFLSEMLVDAGCEVWGVDVSETSLEIANSRLAGRTGWHGATSEDPEREFDAVMCLETVEHLPDRVLADVLARIHGLLHAGGSVLITTPNNEDIRADPVYCPFCDSEFHHMQHVRSFTAETLRQVLDAGGFEVTFCEPVHLLEFARFHVRSDMPRYTAHQALLRTRVRTGLRVDARVPRPHLCAVARKPG